MWFDKKYIYLNEVDADTLIPQHLITHGIISLLITASQEGRGVLKIGMSSSSFNRTMSLLPMYKDLAHPLFELWDRKQDHNGSD
jgi:hypothetical protein